MAISRFILASASARRQALLQSLGFDFEVRPASIDESVRPDEHPRPYVQRMAREKAEHVAALYSGALVLASDTAVIVNGEILGKPKDESMAREMLAKLSGRVHTVLTAVAIAGARLDQRCVETEVQFRRLSQEEISWYVKTGEPLDKAGAYAIQGKGAFLIEGIRGSVSNVVGLPLSETVSMLKRAGVTLPWSGN